MMSGRSKNSPHSNEGEARVVSDDFIESVITPNPQSRDEAMNREFYGMMAVAAESGKEQHDNHNSNSTAGGDEE